MVVMYGIERLRWPGRYIENMQILSLVNQLLVLLAQRLFASPISFFEAF